MYYYEIIVQGNQTRGSEEGNKAVMSQLWETDDH